MNYIEIDKESIPYRFEIELGGEMFGFELHYNERFDFFTIDIEKNGTVVLHGAKIVYGNPVFNFSNLPDLPNVKITPIDEAGNETRAGYNQIGNTVFLIVEAIQ